ncbi:MAG: hypothetical protein II529_04220 [Erysipelotrichaceae bacterium]|nr:hypothetical protein [Erysipelotrichaceae bacterium]
MSAIAYITDSKMLELHRLNNHRTINFWRLSNNTNFSDFGPGDLVFFLSKDKEHRKGREKGIVGFGRMTHVSLASIKTMWDKYGIANGYNTLEEFKEAILKVSKDKKLPKKISGFYLENVTFFQPVYLSECGMKISSNVESYIYLKPEDVVLRLLDLGEGSSDLWSDLTGNLRSIAEERKLFALFAARREIGDIEETEKRKKKAKKALKEYIQEHPEYGFIQNSPDELYHMSGNELRIVFYRDKESDLKKLIGQARLYRHWFGLYCKEDIPLKFLTCDRDPSTEYHLNA